MSQRTTIALLGACGCVGVALLTWIVAFRTGAGHELDVAVLRDLAGLQDTRAASLAQRISHLCDPGPYALLAGTVVAAACVTRGWRCAVLTAAILIGSSAVTQLLKPALAVDRVPTDTPAVHVDPVSWPSGHATAAMALALCAVIAAPAGWRLIVALAGALFAAAVATSVVLLGWHFPSDALAGFAVAGAATCLGVSRPATRAALPLRSQRATG